MENASKALIIAGAILLSILIIALGVYIFNMAKSSVNTDTLSSLDISTFNSQFTQYEGDQLGSSVKSLLTAIIASNNTNINASDRLISVTFYDSSNSKNSVYTRAVGDSGSSNISDLSTDEIANTHHYYVKFSYDDSTTGYISECKIYYNESAASSD